MGDIFLLTFQKLFLSVSSTETRLVFHQFRNLSFINSYNVCLAVFGAEKKFLAIFLGHFFEPGRGGQSPQPPKRGGPYIMVSRFWGCSGAQMALFGCGNRLCLLQNKIRILVLFFPRYISFFFFVFRTKGWGGAGLFFLTRGTW